MQHPKELTNICCGQDISKIHFKKQMCEPFAQTTTYPACHDRKSYCLHLSNFQKKRELIILIIIYFRLSLWPIIFIAHPEESTSTEVMQRGRHRVSWYFKGKQF
jgi:hypothetical protein